MNIVVVKSTLLVHKLNCMLPEDDEYTSCESNPKAIQACLILYYAKSCRECNYLTCLQVQEPMIFYFLLPFLLGFVPTRKHSRANRLTFMPWTNPRENTRLLILTTCVHEVG